jgi:hypothetical protein
LKQLASRNLNSLQLVLSVSGLARGFTIKMVDAETAPSSVSRIKKRMFAAKTPQALKPRDFLEPYRHG